MLKINGNQDKELTFEVEIGGASPDSIVARLRLVLDEIEYGFPAKVTSSAIIVEMPALKKIFHRKVKEGEAVQARLDLTSDGNVVSPWTEVLEITDFAVSEAKLTDGVTKNKVKTLKETEEPTMDAREKAKELIERVESKTRLDSDDSVDLETKIRKRLEENKDNKVENKYSELSGADADVEMSSKIIDKLNEKLFGGKKTKREKQLEKLTEQVDITVARKNAKSAFSPRRAANTKGITLEMIKNFTREDVFAYMSRAGTTNSRVQEILYKQATVASKSDVPVKILKEVIKIIKKNKRRN